MMAAARRTVGIEFVGIPGAKVRIATIVAAFSLAISLLASRVHSAEPADAASEAAEQPTPGSAIQGYGDGDKSCVAWTDACVSCQRDAGGALTCNNIGIACQPQAIKCTARRTEPAKQ